MKCPKFPCTASNIKVAVNKCNSRCKPSNTYETIRLKPNFCCKINSLTQEMFYKENVKYVIEYDFSLLGQTITVPKNCILEFDGGTLSNGTIIGQDTYINDVGGLGVDTLFGEGITRKGTWRMNEGGGSSSGDEDKPYDPDAHSGLGRKTLELGEDGSNILTQEDFDAENTIYVISYDFDLGGKTITIPNGSTLKFEGGSLDNGTVNLNGADIQASLYQIFRDNLNIAVENKRELHSSWVGLKDSGNNTDKVVKTLLVLKDCGVLFLDTDVYIEKPVVVSGLFYTKITSTLSSDKLNNSPKIYGFVSNYVTTTNEHLFDIKAEGLNVKNVKFYWERNSPTAVDINSSLINIDTNKDFFADLDCVLEGCMLSFNGIGSLVSARGRGFYLHNCLLVHPGFSNNFTAALVKVIGKNSGNDVSDAFFAPKDCVRGVSIDGNRVHTVGNNYFVIFQQDPDSNDTTIVNAFIANNVSDFGSLGIVSTSRHRGLLITNNVFTVRSAQPVYFNRFYNTIKGFVFSNNSITCLETDNGERHFEPAGTMFECKKGVEYKDIIFSNNVFDAKLFPSVMAFANVEEFTDNESIPKIENITLAWNVFSERTFLDTSIGIVQSLILASNVNYKNLSIVGNNVPPRTAGLTDTITEDYYNASFEKTRCNIVFNNSIWQDFNPLGKGNTLPGYVITTNNIRPRVAEYTYRDSNDMIMGTSVFDRSVNKPLWWNDHGWVDANGFYGALSKGTTAQRPTTFLNINDNGFKYYDTDINRELTYKATLGTSIIEETVLVGTPKKVPNTCVTGETYLFSVVRNGNVHSIYFCNEDESDKIYITNQQKQQLNSFIAPDSTLYPYIVFEVETLDSVIKVFNMKAWWEEQDGAKAGVNRSGTFAQAPTLSSDIYNGFMYMLVDGTSRFPIYAVISGNSINWYKADGTQYIGS